jgi:uncharacterized spore protein YtfJ
MEQQTLTQNLDSLFANMETFTQKEGLIGKAVTQGDKTFLPVVSVTLGYGGGDTQTKGQIPNSNNTSGNMMGGALGLGCKLSTEAVIVIDKGNVSFAPISGQSNMSQIIDKVPQILSNMAPNGQQKSGQQQGQQPQG